MSAQRFLDVFHGALYSVLSWDQLDDLWSRVCAAPSAGWYVYHVGDTLPTTPIAAASLAALIGEIDTLLRREHKEDYCGIVYADNLSAPSLIKIYDPHNLGVVCGYSTNPPLPGWVLSTMPPAPLPQQAPLAEGRRRWWERILRK